MAKKCHYLPRWTGCLPLLRGHSVASLQGLRVSGQEGALVLAFSSMNRSLLAKSSGRSLRRLITSALMPSAANSSAASSDVIAQNQLLHVGGHGRHVNSDRPVPSACILPPA